ncbi:hypothetical protein VKT23_018952 [Stygiomarasmius scandens]|uniref:Glycosyltransferase 61 catalytic domain-containing protein n=1 Tax=Marasmiellus scandens TaxID=2682957 RepID=A0ABR1IMM0_9AGAR
MVFGQRCKLSRRDAMLVIIGAAGTFFVSYTSLLPSSTSSAIVRCTSYLYDHNFEAPHSYTSQARDDYLSSPSSSQQRPNSVDVFDSSQPYLTSSYPLSYTTILHHAPGWTLFRDVYMSNGTLLLLTPDLDSPEYHETMSRFPQFRMMTSTGLPAVPGNTEEREPTEKDMAFITSREARRKWGTFSTNQNDLVGHRVMTVSGSTLLVNDPPQFLKHYYHLVVELFFGVQAFWYGAFATSSPPQGRNLNLDKFELYSNWQAYDPSYDPHHNWNATPLSIRDYKPFSDSISNSVALRRQSGGGFPLYTLKSRPSGSRALPSITRTIFAHTPIADLKDEGYSKGWRDVPGFNAFFLRTAFPSMTIEGEEDWLDRAEATSARDRAYHFPLLLLTDRSAAFRGTMCGSRTQRTASEAWEYMRGRGLLAKSEEGKEKMGEWWREVKERVWSVVGVEKDIAFSNVIQSPGIAGSRALSLVAKAKRRPVVTYLSRQATPRRRFRPETHLKLVASLRELCQRRRWEFILMEPEKMGRDEQIRIAAKTDILISIHGNGLSHLVFMPSSPIATVIEIFYPGGFAHDYSWTAMALGMDWWGVWDNKTFTHPNEPWVEYPEGFHSEEIPVDAEVVAKLVEGRIDKTW